MSDELPPPLPNRELSTLTYATPAHQFRPGYLTALAIVSIVIGSISALSHLLGLLSAVMLLVLRSPFTRATVGPATVVTVGATTAPTTAPATAPAAFPAFTPGPVFAVGTQLIQAVIALISLGAAGLLIAGGIQLLRDRPIARLLHRLFVWIKIPAAIASMGATMWMYSSMMSTMWSTPAGSPPIAAPPTSLFVIPVVAMGGVSLAYPIAVLIVLHRRRTKAYFAELGPTGG